MMQTSEKQRKQDFFSCISFECSVICSEDYISNAIFAMVKTNLGGICMAFVPSPLSVQKCLDDSNNHFFPYMFICPCCSA